MEFSPVSTKGLTDARRLKQAELLGFFEPTASSGFAVTRLASGGHGCNGEGRH
jgi:hypothetical protein